VKCLKTLFILCVLLLSVSLSAQSEPSSRAEPLPSIDYRPGSTLSPIQPSLTPDQAWTQADELLRKLEAEAMNSQMELLSLQESLTRADSLLATQSKRLEDLQIQTNELSSTLKQSEDSLATSDKSLSQAMTSLKKLNLELWIDRIGLVVLAVLAIVGFAT
jgi:flagellar motor protein MotB